MTIFSTTDCNRTVISGTIHSSGDNSLNSFTFLPPSESFSLSLYTPFLFLQELCLNNFSEGSLLFYKKLFSKSRFKTVFQGGTKLFLRQPAKKEPPQFFAAVPFSFHRISGPIPTVVVVLVAVIAVIAAVPVVVVIPIVAVVALVAVVVPCFV